MGYEIQEHLTCNVWLKKAILLILVSLMPAMVMAQDAEFSGNGEGSSENPYQIETWSQLNEVRNFLDAHYILMNDLDENTTGYTDFVKDMEGEENVVNDGQGWEPIGTNVEPFTGFFDGQGFTISGLHIDRLGFEIRDENNENGNTFTDTPSGVGLFGYVSTGLFSDEPIVEKNGIDEPFLDAAIENLHLEDVDIRAAYGAGALVGLNEGVLSNVSVSGNVRGLFMIGGIAGANAGIMVQNSSEANVLFDVERVIELNESDSEQDTPIFDLDGSDIPLFGFGGMGGLVGFNVGGITLSNSDGNIGLTDELINELEEFAVQDDTLVLPFPPFGYGGLVGINERIFLGAVTVSYSTANVGGFFGSGGLIGLNGFEFFLKRNTVTPFNLNSSLDSSDFDEYFGDLEPLEVRDTYATGTVRGGFSTGGLIGGNSGTVYNSYSAGSVDLFEDAIGDIEDEGPINVGKSNEEEPDIYEQFGLGGLVGDSFNVRLAKSFSDIENFRFSFRNLENTVQEFTEVFGVEEEPEPEFTVYNSFWDLQTSGVPVSQGGTGLNTSQMKTIFTYLEASWDFDNLWAIEEGFSRGPTIELKRNGNFISYPYFGNNPDAPLQTPAPGLSELTNDRVLVGSAENTVIEESDLDFGGGESITILALPPSSIGVFKLDGTEVEADDEIQKTDVENGDLVFESNFPLRSASQYDFFGEEGIQYENDLRTVTLLIDVAARSTFYFEPEGWYFFASPSIGQTVGELLNGIRTDGFPGSTNPGASFPTVYTIDQEAYEWEAVSSIDQVLEQGQALLVYVFQEDLDELDESEPQLLLSNGPWLPLDGTFSFDLGYDPDQGPEGNSHFLIANPHPIVVNICGSLTRSDRVANNYYIWRPSENDGNGGYVNLVCGFDFIPQKQDLEPIISIAVSPLQGFWVRTTDENPSLDIREEDYGSRFILLDPEPLKEAENEKSNLRPLSLNLEHNDRNYSGSAHVLFSNYGSDDLDNYDATHMSSAGLAERYLSLFAIDEENRKYNLQSLPILAQDERIIPLGIETTESGNYTFSWSLPSNSPAGVTYYLRDTKTESLTELEDGGRYSFSLSESEVAPVEKTLTGERNINAKEGAVTTHRFELIATMNELNTGMELPTDISLKQNYPNPFNPTTVIEYQLPQSAQVRLQVYDMAGRQVAELVNEQVSAGSHTINFDASNLSSGVYMYRLQAGTTMLTRKLTVVK
jgi:hypothetical protein